MAVLAGKGGASTQIQSNLAPHLQSGMCLRLVDDGLMAWGGGSELHGSKQDSQVPSLSKVSRSPARSKRTNFKKFQGFQPLFLSVSWCFDVI